MTDNFEERRPGVLVGGLHFKQVSLVMRYPVLRTTATEGSSCPACVLLPQGRQEGTAGPTSYSLVCPHLAQSLAPLWEPQ